MHACLSVSIYMHTHVHVHTHVHTYARTTYELQETPLDAELTSHRLRIRGISLVCREEEVGRPSQPMPGFPLLVTMSPTSLRPAVSDRVHRRRPSRQVGDEDAADGRQPWWLDHSAKAEKCHVLRGWGPFQTSGGPPGFQSIRRPLA